MSQSCPIFFLLLFSLCRCSICFASCDPASCYAYEYVRQAGQKFEQKTDRFWEYEEKSNTWVEVKLPYDLVSCVNDNCTKVGTIKVMNKEEEQKSDDVKGRVGEGSHAVLPLRKRISLTRMSDRSIWVTGQSGSIYERFWNGLQWVVAPHDLPQSAGHAVGVFMVNHTILALSEAGILYQLQLRESSHLFWSELRFVLDSWASAETLDQLASGFISHDKETIYFSTKNRSLVELIDIDPARWINHGRPPGADVEAIVDTGAFRPRVIFTISSGGDLYEYDQSAKPSWKKHMRKGPAENTSLASYTGCALLGLVGAHSTSLFLLTKRGDLVERRLHQRKWKWITHGNPSYYNFTSITCVSQDELDESSSRSMFLTAANGDIYEYHIPKQPGTAQENQDSNNWVNYEHPPQAKAARGFSGIQLQVGRMIFPLDDGRLSELHAPGLGGEFSPPNQQMSSRRKARLKYTWSILEAPESEGWNAEYCTEEQGPSNCIGGTIDEYDESVTRSVLQRRKGTNAEKNYLLIGRTANRSVSSSEEYSMPDNWMSRNFRLRSMPGGKSLLLVTNDGLLLEYIDNQNVQLWLRHEHSSKIRGTVGRYNGSMFVVDEQGSLFLSARGSGELGWINCTAVMKGRPVICGPPWDHPGKALKSVEVTTVFFVSRSGRLLQLTVTPGNFRWKDCKNPPNTRIACIIDQEFFRDYIIFVIGRNSRLYQYNKITELWHEHHQSQHLILSKSLGTTMRPSSISLEGSLFILSENGGLVEYKWNPLDGWHWIEHGTPTSDVVLVGSPGPYFGENQLFLIGSDGKVYLRYNDQVTWKWKDCGFPYTEIKIDEVADNVKKRPGDEAGCIDKDLAASFERMQEQIQNLSENCDAKVSSTRPIQFTEESFIFELRDGRLAELQRTGETDWVWSQTIATPTSLCMAQYVTTSAS